MKFEPHPCSARRNQPNATWWFKPEAAPRFVGRGHVDQRQQIPVAIWRQKTTSAALPKTYHQLAVLRGTGCSAASRIGAASCKR